MKPLHGLPQTFVLLACLGRENDHRTICRGWDSERDRNT